MPMELSPNMGIDNILKLLGEDREESYNKLNMILWSLQAMGAVDFHEDKLDEWYNSSEL